MTPTILMLLLGTLALAGVWMALALILMYFEKLFSGDE